MTCRIPRSSTRTTPSCASPGPPSAAPTSTSTRLRARHGAGRHPRPRVHGRGGRDRQAVANLNIGDRVVVPFPISCGKCWSCLHGLYSLCENSNPNAAMAEKMWGYSPAGIFGYSHLTGGYAGGQAEYARVRSRTSVPLKVPDSVTDEQRCSSATSSRPATWAPRCATSSAATSSRYGARARSGSSPSRARSSSG
jgi:hypothetical protein